MSFHDIRFPSNLSFGAMGGPQRRTNIVTLANGIEERNSPWQHSRRRYDAGMAMRSLDDLEVLTSFFEARQGQLHAFRWKDWADHKSCVPSAAVSATDQLIGFGDGTTTEFQLVKVYSSGGLSYTRPISKPVAGTVHVSVAGIELGSGSDFSVDHLSGLITFISPPGVGEQISAGFEFDVPVRFDTDELQVSLATFNAGQVPDVPVVEVRG